MKRIHVVTGALSICGLLSPILLSKWPATPDEARTTLGAVQANCRFPTARAWRILAANPPQTFWPSGDSRGSLRPDDRTPEERVPHIIERGHIVVGVDQSQNLLSFRGPCNSGR